jgi:glycosyltransferase involved in cell wall biosynthesis
MTAFDSVAGRAEASAPAVSVIVPARNEEECLWACLDSLVGQGGVSFEIVVVDDGSTDRTREIAESFAGVRVVDAGPLPAGWSGKNNALTAGARLARGEWLLFTDADTVHCAGSLAGALAEARAQGAALLSYSPEQEVHGFWERAVMPVIFAELAGRYRPAEVSDPASNVAAANGQYILVLRSAYEAVGGHAAIAGDLLEDVALARAVKRSGRKIFFRFGGDAVRTRMYRSFGQMREGWTKNLALLFPSPLRLAVVRLLEFGLIVGSGVVAGRLGAKDRVGAALAMGVLCAIFYGLFLKRIRRAHFSWVSNVLAVVGLPMFSYLLVRSKVAHREGRVSWKGREYGPQREAIPNSGTKAAGHIRA